MKADLTGARGDCGTWACGAVTKQKIEINETWPWGSYRGKS